MPYLPHLAALAALWLVVVVAPGPNFLTAVAVSTTRDRRAGVLAAFGFALGDAIWATSSLLGLAVLLDRYRWLTDLVRYGGAAVLLLLGARALLHARRSARSGPTDPTGSAEPVEPGPAAARRRFRSPVLTGLLVDLGNPKAAVFFTSLFAALLPPTVPVWVGAVAVAEVAAIPALWYSAVACAFSAARVAAGYRRLRRPIDALTGGLFVALGIRLATSD
jgi:threonine/homoserine/homoserine lactone efflux protein